MLSVRTFTGTPKGEKLLFGHGANVVCCEAVSQIWPGWAKLFKGCPTGAGGTASLYKFWGGFGDVGFRFMVPG